MALGVDLAVPINDATARWVELRTFWGGKIPRFAGRYFGTTAHHWVNGELAALADPPTKASLLDIIPFGPTGQFTDDQDRHVAGQHVVVFYEQEGTEPDGTVLPARTVERTAKRHATATCNGIRDAIKNGDLVLPPSKQVLVFLDVETQTKLSPHYWSSWSSTISGALVDEFTADGTINPIQPFLPGVYCAWNAPAPWPSVRASLAPPARGPSRYMRWPYAPHALYSLHPQLASRHVPRLTDADLAALTEAAVIAEWPAADPGFGPLVDPISTLSAPVAVWQFKLQLVVAGFAVDLCVALAGGPDGRPITDFTLKRAP